mmetsp:Transcript_1395/g.5970  ORF Transcript_1395/g.5970 Transcript_1395/m.5970 type:complete len:420 (+) Transcript_1395:9815-11074(+)
MDVAPASIPHQLDVLCRASGRADTDLCRHRAHVPEDFNERLFDLLLKSVVLASFSQLQAVQNQLVRPVLHPPRQETKVGNDGRFAAISIHALGIVCLHRSCEPNLCALNNLTKAVGIGQQGLAVHRPYLRAADQLKYSRPFLAYDGLLRMSLPEGVHHQCGPRNGKRTADVVAREEGMREVERLSTVNFMPLGHQGQQGHLQIEKRPQTTDNKAIANLQVDLHVAWKAHPAGIFRIEDTATQQKLAQHEVRLERAGHVEGKELQARGRYACFAHGQQSTGGAGARLRASPDGTRAVAVALRFNVMALPVSGLVASDDFDLREVCCSALQQILETRALDDVDARDFSMLAEQVHPFRGGVVRDCNSDSQHGRVARRCFLSTLGEALEKGLECFDGKAIDLGENTDRLVVARAPLHCTMDL